MDKAFNNWVSTYAHGMLSGKGSKLEEFKAVALDAWNHAMQVAASDIVDLRYCELDKIILAPGRIYRFTVDEDCKQCLEAAKRAA